MQLTWEQCDKLVRELGFPRDVMWSNDWPRRAVGSAVNNARRSMLGEHDVDMPPEASLPLEMATLVIAMILVSHGWPT